MKSVNLYGVVMGTIFMASCVNPKTVNIEGVCSNCMDGTPIELYYLQNDSVINVASDTLLSGKSRALLPPSPLRTVRESFPSYGSSNSIFLFVVRNRLILSTVSFISLVAVVMDKLPYN